MSSEYDLQQVLPAWLELASKTDVSLGLDPRVALQRAEELLTYLRSGKTSIEGWASEADKVEVLHALVALVCSGERNKPEPAQRDTDLVFGFILELPWRAEDFGGPGELLSACALQGWRTARCSAGQPEIKKWVSRVRDSADATARLERALSVPAGDRKARALELGLSDPRLVLCLCDPPRVETSPMLLREEAAFFYAFIGASDQVGPTGEREYLQGELALTAGAACRFLFRMEDAENWFRLAETHFARVRDGDSHRARVTYQRLALAVEERRFDEVLDFAPPLRATFRRFGMSEDALKCSFIEASSFGETGEEGKAIDTLSEILSDANHSGDLRLAAMALNNLARFHANLGQSEEALSFAHRALPLLQQLGNEVTLVKLQWTIADLLRKQGEHLAALDAYREAQGHARKLGVRGDVASIHLVIADMLLDAGQEAQAEREIREALPIIEKQRMVKEGIAALSLLRESLRRRQIDHGALRDLHRHLVDRHR